jgi:hypothetical protein
MQQHELGKEGDKGEGKKTASATLSLVRRAHHRGSSMAEQ